MTEGVLWAIGILAGGGALLILLGTWLKPRWAAWASLAVLLGALCAFWWQRTGPLEIAVFEWSLTSGWPISITYRFDTVAQAFALLALLPAALLLFWMGLGAPHTEGRFSPWVLLFLALFLHLLSSADLLLAYAGWELFLLGTYFLLCSCRSRLPTPGIAEWYLGAQHLAGYPLLAALLLIGRAAGTLHYGLLSPTAVGSTALLLLLGTIWVRMAQVPFQRWATAAAESPGPVHTLLLGSWSLLAGPYLWVRFLSRALPHIPREAVLIAGSASLVIGAVLALRQERGRQVQAGDAISRLGMLWIAFGLDQPLGLAAGWFLLFDFLLSKVVFHLALSDEQRLDPPIRRALYAVGMWQALGLPPSTGFVGRWLLWLALIRAGRPIYLLILALSIPLTLIYLWRGWTLIPQRKEEPSPLPPAVQWGILGCAALLPGAGLAASWLWRHLLERSSMAVLGSAVLQVGPALETVSPWLLSWTVLLLLAGGGALLWGGTFRRARPLAEARVGEEVGAAGEADTVAGLLQETLSPFSQEIAWLGWIGGPVLLYRFVDRMIGRAAASINRLVTFLERHTTFFMLVVLVAVVAGLLIFMR